MPDAPVIALVNAVLLSAIKKQATWIGIRRLASGEAAIDFELDGAHEREMTPPAELLPFIVRRIGVMANVPVHARGAGAVGHIHLHIGGEREAFFRVLVEGHGDSLSAQLRTITRAEMPR